MCKSLKRLCDDDPEDSDDAKHADFIEHAQVEIGFLERAFARPHDHAAGHHVVDEQQRHEAEFDQHPWRKRPDRRTKVNACDKG